MLKSLFSKLKGLFSFKIKMPKLPKFNLFKTRVKLYRVWKRFLRQIPPTYRHFIQSYPSHFIVLGDERSGKSQLIHKHIDQEKDVYSFETTYTAEPDVQLYLGQRCILQEIAWNLVEDRSVRAKKELTQLWRNLYASKDPTIVIAFNPTFWEKTDFEKVNHHARLILNKIGLLSHIIDKPIKIRIALTHSDLIPGYSELMHILRIYGISLEVPLDHFDSDTIRNVFHGYEQLLSLALKNSNSEGYLKILNFLKRLEEISPVIDQFIRSLMQKDFEKKVVSLEKGYFVSNQEIDLNSEIFECEQREEASVYIKRHYFKHKVASVGLALAGCVCLAGASVVKKQELIQIRKRIALLERYQSSEYLDKVIPVLPPLVKISTAKIFLTRLEPFFYGAYKRQIVDFIENSRNFVLIPAFQKILMKNQAEIELVYLLGLCKATKDNRLGQLILENTKEWAEMLELPEPFIHAYVSLSDKPQPVKEYLERFNLLYNATPLTNEQPWISFFKHVQQYLDHPDVLTLHFEDLKMEAAGLLASLHRLKEHSLSPFVCKILQEDGELKSHIGFLPKIQLIQSLRDNYDVLDQFLKSIQGSNLDPALCNSLCVNGFLECVEDFIATCDLSNHSYHFILADKRWMFESSKWSNTINSLKVKKIVDDYIVNNREMQGASFFKNIGQLLDLDFSYLGEVFPEFQTRNRVGAYYARNAYEKYVFPVSDKLRKLNDSTLLTADIKNDLNKFIAAEVESYAREYRRQYQEIIAQLNIVPESIEEVRAVVGFMIEPLSHFTYFLQTLKHNLDVPFSESLVLQPMQYLREFQFLNMVLSDHLEKGGELLTYQNILREMLDEIAPRSFVKGGKGDENLFLGYLSLVGRFSLAILGGQGVSYVSLIQKWLTDTAVPHRYHQLFLNPANWIHEIGLADLKSSIELAWKEQCEPEINALFAKFPFSSDGQELATVEELQHILHPSSHLWSKIEQIIGPVSWKEDQSLEAKYPELLKLDENIFRTAHAMAKATQMLWDEQGNFQPLVFKVQTVPFKLAEHRDNQTVMSFLITKGQSLFNINQKPQWQTIKTKWWEPDEISIGIELLDINNNVHSYQNMKFDKEIWNIFQLLKEGQQTNGQVWQWQFSNDRDHVFALHFEKNPWEVLNTLN